EMLRRLLAKAGRKPSKVALADATRLPFRDRTFTAAVAAHVFHLIPDWKGAIDELLRVMMPGGVLLASRGADAKADWHRAVRRRFFHEAGDPRWPPGINGIGSLDE